MLRDICSTYDFNATCFRYFNAAGAHESGDIGEQHDPETHLIPNVLKSVVSDNSQLKVFGDDYPTHDGTCVRDYVHVVDLAQAHLLGLDKMRDVKGFNAFNLGNGNGFSVLDVVKSCERVVGHTINYQVDDKRSGDPAVLVADSSLVADSLGWKASYDELDSIVGSAWKWHNK